MHTPYDRGSQWLYQHFGRALVRLLGVQQPIQSCKALAADVVQPRQLPDGLLEVHFEGRPEPDLFLLEIATFPEARVEEQMVRDTLLVFLDRRVLPEVWTVVLHPRGVYRVPPQRQVQSPLGTTHLHVRWNVVELWTLPAELLLATNEVGLVPLVPLTQFEGPPEPLLRECRKRIDAQAKEEERPNLLAVAQVLARLRYNTPSFQAIFGGRQVMIDSPLFQEMLDEVLPEYIRKAELETQRKTQLSSAQRAIMQVLTARFHVVPPELLATVQQISDQNQLDALLQEAATCLTVETFRSKPVGPNAGQ